MVRTQKEKIRILVPIFYPVGGIKTYIKYTYGKFDRNIYEFDFVAPSKEWLERIKEDLKGFKVGLYPLSYKYINIAFVLLIVKLLLKKKYHIIHSQGYTAGILSNIANIIYKVPHIVTIHHIFGHGQFSDTFLDKFKWIKIETIRTILSRTNIIQAVSNDAMENLVEYFPGLKKIQNKLVTIVNGIDIVQFLGNDDSEEAPFKIEEDFFYVGFIGRFMPEKGFQYLIDAMDKLVNKRQIKNIRVVSAGGFGGFIREYKKKILRRNLNEYFIFFDFFDNIKPFLTSIHVLAIPSNGEACGLAAMEGVVCGTPIVAFNCIGLREVLSGTPAKLVKTGNVLELTNAIENIQSNYKNFKGLALDYVEEAKVRYDSKKTANKLEKVIIKMVER